MNYFDLHIGDYEAATVHLSMLEDAAYCRMLRVYYRTEKPLPADIRQVCRLVRAQSKPERDAVQSVLDEFFTLADDGWHQDRADAEIGKFRDSEPEREVRKANEETRVKRHREERAALFKLLNENGQHAPWNTKIEELRRIAEPFKVPTETPPETLQVPKTETQPVTAPATLATATHGNVPPPPTSHLPELKEKPPIPPKGPKPAAVGLKTWLEAEKAGGRKAIPDGDPVFAYADEVGIPREFLALGWAEFRHRYCQPDAKRYRDWRSVFRKAVRGNWLKLWFLDGENYALTTAGQQARKAQQAKDRTTAEAAA